VLGLTTFSIGRTGFQLGLWLFGRIIQEFLPAN
jgi:hypothetical protein